MKTEHLHLSVLEEILAVCRLGPDAPVPAWATSGMFFSITRTMDELSIVCPISSLAADVTAETGWRAIKIAGPLDFNLVGVLASITSTLANAAVSIFAISTYDTDYILVRGSDLDHAIDALVSDGHHVNQVA